MSVVRKHFWHVVSRGCGGSSWPRKYGRSGCIPAVVSSTDGSYEDGTSDPDACSLWPRSWKKSRNAARISGEVRGGSALILGRDGAVTDDAIPGHQARDLSRGDRKGLVVEPDGEARMRPGGQRRVHARGRGDGAVAQLHPVDLVAWAKEDGVFDAHLAGRELLTCTHHDDVRVRVLREHEQRLPGRDSEVASLAHRVAALAAMYAEPPAGAIADLARDVAPPAVTLQEPLAPRAREEAQVLALGL